MRILVSGVVAAIFVGFSGCGGDSDTGIPADAPAKSNLDMSSKFDKMKDAAKDAKKAPSVPAVK